MRPSTLFHWLAGLLCLAVFAAQGAQGVDQRPPAASASVPAASASAPAASAPARQLNLAVKPWQGDFDAMLERRMIRVLVPYSRTLYFNDKGSERGLTAELMRDFERYLNKTYADRLGKRPLTIFIIPTTRDRLLPGLAQGLGDIAAGNLTVTDERLKQADFFAPRDRKPVRELVVTGPKSPQIATLEDLAGKTVHVRRASSYYESLTALDKRLRDAGKPPIKLTLLPDALEDEDVLEMLNAGLLQIAVVDDWKAAMWAQILPKVKVHNDIAVRSDAVIGWAMRKNSPQLQQVASDFYLQYAKKQGVVDYRLKQAMKRVKQIANNTEAAELKRFQQALALFEKYGKQYDFDPLMLAAQGFQESQLNQEAHSRVGAIGVMQIMPSTGKSLNVGDIRTVESNIHAGTKYMDQLMTRYFPDARFTENNRPLFAFASYNAGPGNIAKMRKAAEERGLDPNKWFNNVEIVVAEQIGLETTTYVRNIYKYYAAYRLLLEAQEQRSKAMQKARQ
ncbi:transglycosylase SLT domain-containing protein [Cupriavidus sp. 2TAF22]|uniref:transglycosylase SLT domain-containing protein n=1 Tax=unclassified Cupriavidus TaxID=2640874 RepID=UPI003F8FEBFD